MKDKMYTKILSKISRHNDESMPLTSLYKTLNRNWYQLSPYINKLKEMELVEIKNGEISLT